MSVGRGEPLCTLLVNDEKDAGRCTALLMVRDAFAIGEGPVDGGRP